MCLNDEFELLFIATLREFPVSITTKGKRVGVNLIRMVLQTFSSICLLDLTLGTIPGNTQNLVIILCLTPLQRSLCFLQLSLECLHIGVIAFELCLLYSRLEIRNGCIEFLKVKIYPRTRSKSFERTRVELK